MKKLFILIALALITVSSFGQFEWNINFEDPIPIERIFIDTISNTINIWQIGIPGKIMFNSAHSPIHAIITDTLNPYRVNDTSRFVITHVRQGPNGGNESLLLDFYFKINTDSLSDYGSIEVSIDHGTSWINLLTQDSVYGFRWLSQKPVLTGTKNSWTHYSEELSSLTYNVGYSDTLLFRFTFISDNIQTNKEGWIIDDLLFHDYWEGMNEVQNDNLISISPNPASKYILIRANKLASRPRVQIINFTGQILYNNLNFKGEKIDIHSIPDGIYLIKYYGDTSFALQKFEVHH
ncbi:MAG: T9SS type A sorting domain-containing protein [Bacteroidetes bacterium]|nr:T9SS type A sorting domain-containing protein [Bacteroidota bacterium]